MFTDLGEGDHTVGIKAIYQSGASETATYTIAGKSGVTQVTGDSSDAPAQLFDLSGRRVSDSETPAGVYILRQGTIVTKIIKK